MTDAEHPYLEKCLYLWAGDTLAHRVALSDELLIQQAKIFGERIGIEHAFQYSKGWLHNFKKRYNLTLKTLRGESASVDLNLVASGKKDMKVLTSQYDLDNIYNFDETALFYRLQPNKTLASKSINGIKTCKDRISLGICANATGSDKCKLVLISKFGRPRCFGKLWNPNLLVHYFYNKKAWMTVDIFDQWLEKFNSRMKKENRKVLLLLDNAAGHGTAKVYENLNIQYLPPNTTSHLQPMDAGIIWSFKYSSSTTKPIQSKLNNQEYKDFSSFLRQFEFVSKEDAISALDFLEFDNDVPIGEILSIDDILRLADPYEKEENIDKELLTDSDVNNIEPVSVTSNEVNQAYEKIRTYIEQSNKFVNADLDLLANLKSKIDNDIPQVENKEIVKEYASEVENNDSDIDDENNAQPSKISRYEQDLLNRLSNNNEDIENNLDLYSNKLPKTVNNKTISRILNFNVLKIPKPTQTTNSGSRVVLRPINQTTTTAAANKSPYLVDFNLSATFPVLNEFATSVVLNQATTSFVSNQVTCSFVSNQVTCSSVSNQAITSSVSNQAITSSVSNQAITSSVSKKATTSSSVNEEKLRISKRGRKPGSKNKKNN